MTEEKKEEPVFIRANKVFFLERYFSHFDSDKNRRDLDNKIKTTKKRCE